MTCDPFMRAANPVGVRTIELRDSAPGGGAETVELWYPATERVRGQDLDPATRDRFTFAPEFPEASQSAVRNAEAARGRFPLIMHNHGAFGHRRVNTTLCTHLASHGYIVASNDVNRNTTAESHERCDRAAKRRAPAGGCSAGCQPQARAGRVLRHRSPRRRR